MVGCGGSYFILVGILSSSLLLFKSQPESFPCPSFYLLEHFHIRSSTHPTAHAMGRRIYGEKNSPLDLYLPTPIANAIIANPDNQSALHLERAGSISHHPAPPVVGGYLVFGAGVVLPLPVLPLPRSVADW